MIEIYNADNTIFENNGDMTLFPESCNVEAGLNGSWEMQMEHPIDEEERWKYIKEGAVIAAPFLMSKKQLFRIYWKKKGNTGISAKARPVFFDAAGEVFLNDVRPTSKNGQEALDVMTSGQTKYKAISNIAKESTAYYIRKNLIEALQSDNDQSFINRWGGEVFYDNYNVYVNERVGLDNGLHIEIGLNSDAIEAEIDMSDVATRIVPISYNGYGITDSNPWIDSPLIDKYPVVYTKVVEFREVKMREDVSESDDENVIICDSDEERNTALTNKCKELFDSGIDRPTANYKVSLIDLSQIEQFKDIKKLRSVSLGDTVHCKNAELDIETDGRIIKVVYDCIQEKNESVEIGQFTRNYINDFESALRRIDEAINDNGTVKAEKVFGIIDAVRTMMRAQATSAHPAPVRATIFEDLNPESQTYGALCLGTMGFQIAYQRTADGKEWDWRTFGTGKGFFADYIVAGTMLADRIRAGKLQSQDFTEGKSGFELDLDTGVITFYDSDDSGNASKLVFSDGGITITNLNTGDAGKVSIRYQKVGDDYYPIISGTNGETGYSMNQNALIFMVGSLIKSSIGLSDGKGYVATDELTVREKILVGGSEGKSGRAEFSDGSYMRFENGILVEGYTTEGGGI